MDASYIILIVVFSYLRKTLNSKLLLPDWDKLLHGGLLASIALLVIEVTVKTLRPFAEWSSHLIFIGIIYLVLKRKAFVSVKSIAYAILPYVIINLLNDIVKLVSRTYYNKWDNYFQIAGLFVIIWMIAMFIINKKQSKVLEAERQKALEKEREFQLSESLKASLEVQVSERTAELVKQKQALEQTLDELKSTQSQLIQSEKMASLGELTAGIAHEIQNPLNFVNNFSEVNKELLVEMKLAIEKGDFDEVNNLVNDIAENEDKINYHGKRADGIVKGMLQHSRSRSEQKELADINLLTDEYLRLAYHGLRAKDKSFNATLKTDFDENIGSINIFPQEIGRVILNLITNAFYVVAEKKKRLGSEYEPIVHIVTKKQDQHVLISVTDNGNGIQEKVLEKIFQPFFTTKPTGQGTGLGLSMSYDIVTKGHGGTLTVKTAEGIGSTFTITLPK